LREPRIAGASKCWALRDFRMHQTVSHPAVA
jgi:hypothetical protein